MYKNQCKLRILKFPNRTKWKVTIDNTGKLIATRVSNIEQTTTSYITTLDKNNKITIYPNPVENELTISVENSNAINIEIYSIEGKMVFMKSFNNNKASINIADRKRHLCCFGKR